MDKLAEQMAVSPLFYRCQTSRLGMQAADAAHGSCLVPM